MKCDFSSQGSGPLAHLGIEVSLLEAAKDDTERCVHSLIHCSLDI